MRFTLGRKLDALLVSMLLLSILGIGATATELFITDHTQLLRKGALDTAALLSARVRAEMAHLGDRLAILGSVSFGDFRYPEDRLLLIEENLARDPHIVALSVYRGKTDFAPAWRIAAPGAPAKTELLELDRNFPLDLQKLSHGETDFAVVTLADGSRLIRIGLPFVRERTGLFSQLLLAELRPAKLEALFSESTEYTGTLVDRNGRILASGDPLRFAPGTELGASPILVQARTQGDRSFQLDFTDSRGRVQIGAFHPVGFAGLAVVTQTPRERIDRATQGLKRRVALLGLFVLSCALLLSLGISRSITRPIIALAAAAERVGAGDFSVQVATSGTRLRDEIWALGTAFNSMASKISGLLRENVAKARMEKELETARVVQSRFFPKEGLRELHFGLEGKLIAASECCGDWWNFVRIEERLLIAVGDVTGHGVSAALVTSAVHGAFARTVRELQSAPIRGPQVEERLIRHLARELDLAVRESAQCEASMPITISCLSPDRRLLYTLSAAHPLPLLIRDNQYLAAPCATRVALGEPGAEPVEFQAFELRPGDIILWYTDGLTECPGQDGRTLRKKALLQQLSVLGRQASAGPDGLRDGLAQLVRAHLGPETPHPEDDITFVVGVVPVTSSGIA
ncbi:MAG: SpoIIE family protein phosphatase [Oligoflexia bacterium]|nr:SpoIIE family protein phosphatase [Oligoflexia bacterium]